MLYKRFTIIFSIIFLLSLLLTGQALAAAGDTIRVSVDSAGTQGNGTSETPAVSSDGRYVAFESSSSNLVAGDTNGVWDIFLRDTLNDTTIRVSIASDGTQANGSSFDAVISADGRFIAFSSDASNLVAGDTNGARDVFLRDTLSNTTTRVSVASDGTQANQESLYASISADGRYVAFSTASANLVTGDTNGTWDVFVRDTSSGTTTRISLASDGTQGNATSFWPSVSSDGRYVAFVSDASNLVAGDTNGRRDIFLRDTSSGITTRLSIASDGTQTNERSVEPAISADGRYIVFESFASNLVAGDANGTGDVFLRDTLTNTTTHVSVASGGTAGNAWSAGPAISADGRYVAFESFASNLIVGDTNGTWDVFVRDTLSNTTTRVSLASDGTQANNQSGGAMISADGRFIAFGSPASNLVAGDTNGLFDVFLHETSVVPLPTSTPTSVPTSTPTSIPTSTPTSIRTFTPTPGTTSISMLLPSSVVMPATGFAPNVVTALQVQPAMKAYADEGMTLEIPSLNLKSAIVGVPRGNNGEWDLSWLDGSIGYLAGTAFPTWAGNSVLTGHVYEADGQPGPFVNLGKLWWGQQVIIHAWGQQYIYQVRSASLRADPANTDVLTEHEEYPWLTLITCRDYDKKTNSYRWRTVIRAVLIAIRDKP